MNILDVIIGLLLAWAAFKGFKKGLIIEAGALVALILGVFAAAHYSGVLGGYLTKQHQFSSEYTVLISFVITFVLVVVVVFVLAKLVDRFVNMLAMGLINKLAGLLFGVLRSAFFLSVLIFILGAFQLELWVIPQEKRAQSKLYGPVAKIAPAIIPHLKQLWAREYPPLQQEDEHPEEQPPVVSV